jgi:hypothetical protein
MQQYFSFMTPMLAKICGRGLLVAMSTRTVTSSVGRRGQPMAAAYKIAVHWAGRAVLATMDSWQRSAGQMQPDRGLAHSKSREDAALCGSAVADAAWLQIYFDSKSMSGTRVMRM